MYGYDREYSSGHPRRGFDAPYRGGYGRPRPWTDRDTWVAVRQTLFEDTWLDARRIEIEVQDGVVTLSGQVKDHMAARYAWDDAWESQGVRGVISRLEVSPGRRDSVNGPLEQGEARGEADEQE